MSRIAAAVLLLLAACRPDPPPRARALQAYAYDVALPHFRAFAAAAERLADTPTPETWRAARRAWAVCGAHLIGPEQDRLLAAKIDAFPAEPQDAPDVERLGAGRKGFFALETLLFGDNRPALASALARNIAAVAKEILAGWENGFAEALATAGRPGSPFKTRQEAFDRIVNHIVAFAERTVDRLAWPAGLVAGAEGRTDPSLLAGRRSGEALEDLRGAVESLRRVYDGALRSPLAKAAPEIDAALRSAFDAAARDLAAIPEPLERSLADHPEALRAAVGSLRTLQSRLAIDLAGVFRTTLTVSPFDGD